MAYRLIDLGDLEHWKIYGHAESRLGNLVSVGKQTTFQLTRNSNGMELRKEFSYLVFF